MNIKEKLKNLLHIFEKSLFSNHSCISCGKEIPDGTKFSLCEKCFKELEIISGKTCKKCGEPLSEFEVACDLCSERNYHFKSNHSFAYYTNTASNIIKNFKYGKNKYLSFFVANMMFENKAYFDNIDYISFVPMSDDNQRKRGFNQAEEIAMQLSTLTNIELIKLFEKDKTKIHQAGLTQKERLKNINGSIHLIEENSKIVKGKNILIIDDVFTTGATLDECSKQLKPAKPKNIYTYTFAKTKFGAF